MMFHLDQMTRSNSSSPPQKRDFGDMPLIDQILPYIMESARTDEVSII